MEIEYPVNKEVIDYENKYVVTWYKGKYHIEERVSDSIFKPIKEYNSLEETLVIYNDLLEKEERGT